MIRSLRLPIVTSEDTRHCDPKCLRFVKHRDNGDVSCRLFGKLEKDQRRHQRCLDNDSEKGSC